MSTSIYYLIATYVIIIGALVGYNLWLSVRIKTLDHEKNDLSARATQER